MTTATFPAIDQNKAIYRDFIESVFNRGQLHRLDEFLDPGYVLHDPPPGTPAGRAAVAAIVTTFRSAFPDLRVTIQDQVAEGDRVCSLALTEGTHRGTIFGAPPTGRRVQMSGLTLVRIEQGRVAESWVKNDVAALMAQLRPAAG